METASANEPAEMNEVQRAKVTLSMEEANALTCAGVIQELSSDEKVGLTSEEVEKRLPAAQLKLHLHVTKPNVFQLLVDQFRSTVVVILLIATAASLIAKEYLQAAGIGIAVLINSIVGFLTEYRSQMSLAELEKLSGPLARVRRDSVDKNIAVTDLVPGDIVLLTEGDRVPADLRLINSTNLIVDESALTGESIAVYKSDETDNDTANGTAILFQGSIISAGKAKAIVVATGFDTKLGRLGRTLTSLETRSTPLQEELEQLGRQLSIVIVVVCVVLFFIGLAKAENPWQMLQTSIALAIAAIPEGLPVIATLALAEGTRQMVKLGALTRRLSAVETLGCTEIICTDKTGTLTTNEMTVSNIVAGKHHFSVSGSGHLPNGSIFDESGVEVNPDQVPHLSEILMAGILCNDAKLEAHDLSDWHIHGDPTEGALLTVALKGGLKKSSAENTHKRLQEFSFDLKRKRMTTVHADEDGLLAYCKGAPESVFAICTKIETADGIQPLDKQARERLEQQNQSLAGDGLRVLAFARKHIGATSDLDQQHVETEMTFLGLMGMSDQAKDGVGTAIGECKRAGIKVIMVTGDQPTTACAIAKNIGIVPVEGSAAEFVLSGGGGRTEWHDDANKLEKISVLARIEPDGKFRIIKALQAAGKVVAMTGDGVNDAAALKQADIGIAMGQGGTSLAREASDMVLTDDNFSVIVRAIEQGRTIYANIRCSIAYLLTASFASVFVVAFASILYTTQPLSAIQLLWLNLIMHIFPGLGLALQKSHSGIMNEKPRGRTQSLLDAGMWQQIIARALIVALICLVGISIGRNELIKTQTITLSIMAIALLMQSWSWLTTRQSTDIKEYLFNAPMVISTVLGMLMLLAATSCRPIQEILNTTTLTVVDWMLVMACAVSTFLITTTIEKVLFTIHRKYEPVPDPDAKR